MMRFFPAAPWLQVVLHRHLLRTTGASIADMLLFNLVRIRRCCSCYLNCLDVFLLYNIQSHGNLNNAHSVDDFLGN